MGKKNYTKYYIAAAAIIIVIIATAILYINSDSNTSDIEEENSTTIDGGFFAKTTTTAPLNDKDSDGIKAANDCDDTDSSVGRATTYFIDADGDGFGSTTETQTFCPGDLTFGYIDNRYDCDDANSAINPTATEFCDGIDNDCNDGIDESDCSNLDLSIESATAEMVLSETTTADGLAAYYMTVYINIKNNAYVEDAIIGSYDLSFPDYSSILPIPGTNNEIIPAGESLTLEHSFLVYENIGDYEAISNDGYIDIYVMVDLEDTLSEANEYNNERTVRANLS